MKQRPGSFPNRAGLGRSDFSVRHSSVDLAEAPALVVLRGLLGRAPADGDDVMERIVTAAYAQEPLACRPG